MSFFKVGKFRSNSCLVKCVFLHYMHLFLSGYNGFLSIKTEGPMQKHEAFIIQLQPKMFIYMCMIKL